MSLLKLKLFRNHDVEKFPLNSSDFNFLLDKTSREKKSKWIFKSIKIMNFKNAFFQSFYRLIFNFGNEFLRILEMHLKFRK